MYRTQSKSKQSNVQSNGPIYFVRSVVRRAGKHTLAQCNGYSSRNLLNLHTDCVWSRSSVSIWSIMKWTAHVICMYSPEGRSLCVYTVYVYVSLDESDVSEVNITKICSIWWVWCSLYYRICLERSLTCLLLATDGRWEQNWSAQSCI